MKQLACRGFPQLWPLKIGQIPAGVASKREQTLPVLRPRRSFLGQLAKLGTNPLPSERVHNPSFDRAEPAPNAARIAKALRGDLTCEPVDGAVRCFVLDLPAAGE